MLLTRSIVKIIISPFLIVSNKRALVLSEHFATFYNNKLATLFGWGRVVRTIRRWGLHQDCMILCLEKLKLGELVIPFNIGSVDS